MLKMSCPFIPLPEYFLRLGADRDEIKVHSNKLSLLLRFPLDLKTDEFCVVEALLESSEETAILSK